MGIEIDFCGRLELARIEEFSNSIDELTQSIGGFTRRSQFHLPEDVTSHMKEVDGVLGATRQSYPRPARGELVLVWEVAAPSFGSPFAICCNVDWKGALVLYYAKIGGRYIRW